MTDWILKDGRYINKKTQNEMTIDQYNELIRYFNHLYGYTGSTEQFDYKDWARFDRLAENYLEGELYFQ